MSKDKYRISRPIYRISISFTKVKSITNLRIYLNWRERSTLCGVCLDWPTLSLAKFWKGLGAPHD